jgi:predicted nuclease of predicted toxin-antitoxin system
MRIVVDMNLSPDWCAALVAAGHDAIHRFQVGDPTAPDPVIMDWALAQHRVVLTHDLDFGALLAFTSAPGPSVIQVRAQDTMSSALVSTVLAALAQFQTELSTGALVVVQPGTMRARVLPLNR